MELAALFAIVACSGSAADPGDTAGLDSSDTAPDGDTEAVDVAFDECAAVVGDEVPEARDLGAYATEAAVADDAVVVLASAEDVAAWLEGTGLNPDDFTDGLDFSAEQLVGHVWWNGLNSGVGRWLSAFGWNMDRSELVGIVEVDEACTHSDDAMATVELWATPIAPVSRCDIGVRCE